MKVKEVAGRNVGEEREGHVITAERVEYVAGMERIGSVMDAMGLWEYQGKGTFVSKRRKISKMKVKIVGPDVEANKVHVIGAERMECVAERGKIGSEKDVTGAWEKMGRGMFVSKSHGTFEGYAFAISNFIQFCLKTYRCW